MWANYHSSGWSCWTLLSSPDFLSGSKKVFYCEGLLGRHVCVCAGNWQSRGFRGFCCTESGAARSISCQTLTPPHPLSQDSGAAAMSDFEEFEKQLSENRQGERPPHPHPHPPNVPNSAPLASDASTLAACLSPHRLILPDSNFTW